MTRPSNVLAMISYQSLDLPAAELLHEELAIRGMAVAHDQCSFLHGSRIAEEMRLAVTRCDALVSYLTPHSLYLGTASGSPRPALDNEFLPAMARRRRSLAELSSAGAADPRQARPVIIPICKGLGDRSAAAQAVFDATGEDVSSFWMPGLDPAQDLTQSEAADVARGVLEALLGPDADNSEEPLTVSLATRGTDSPSALMSIDATSILGGADRRPGIPADWERVMRALRDVEASLSAFSRVRVLDCVVNAHISGALLFGRVFNQVRHWTPRVTGRAGIAEVVSTSDAATVLSSWDDAMRGRDISVEIDLVGQPVFDLATDAIRTHGLLLQGRLQISRRGIGDMGSAEISQMAADAAQIVRSRVTVSRPPTIHLFCAIPAEFAVLLGHRLTALGADIVSYERDADRYVAAVTIPQTL